MATGEHIATLDVSPEMLAEFAPIIGRLCKVVGTADCDHGIRLKVSVPTELGSRVQVVATKTLASIQFQLVSAA